MKDPRLLWSTIVLSTVLAAVLAGCQTMTKSVEPLKMFDALEREAAQYGLLAAGAPRVSMFDSHFLDGLRQKQLRLIEVLYQDLLKAEPQPQVSQVYLEAVEKLFSLSISFAKPLKDAKDATAELNEEFFNRLQKTFKQALQKAVESGAVEPNRIDMARLRLQEIKYLTSEIENISLLQSSPPDDRYKRVLLSVGLTALVRPQKASAAVVYLDLYPSGADDWAHHAGGELWQRIQKLGLNAKPTRWTKDEIDRLQEEVNEYWPEEVKKLWAYRKSLIAPELSITGRILDPIAVPHRYLSQNHLVPRLVYVEPVDESEYVSELLAREEASRYGLGLAGGIGELGGSLSMARGRIQQEAKRLARIRRQSLAFAAGSNRAGWLFLPSTAGDRMAAMKPTERRIRMVVDVPKDLVDMTIHVHKVFLDEALLPIETTSFAHQLAALNKARYIVSVMEEAYPDRPQVPIDPDIPFEELLQQFEEQTRQIDGTTFISATNWRLAKSRLRNFLKQAWSEELHVVIPSRTESWLLGVEAEQPPWAIHGTIVTEHGAKEGWVVFHRGVIVSVGAHETEIPPTAKRHVYPGYIFPGLIDTHNHPHYSAIPKWDPGRKFGNRNEWTESEDYDTSVRKVYDDLHKAGDAYASLKYGEVRALIGGTTSLQGSYTPPESKLLVRNIGAAYRAEAFTPDIRELKGEELQRLKSGLDYGPPRRRFFHLAEGVDEKSAAEFEILRQKGFVRPGVVLIHGIALDRSQFKEMAKSGMYLVWSPSSNCTLYGRTADVLAAIEEGVTVALAPDWTLTGSDNVLEELKVAWDYSQKQLKGKLTPRDLFRMVTINAAEVAGMQGFLGRIAPRYAADLLLAKRINKEDPYLSLVNTYPQHIDLVFIDGMPVYGEPKRLAKLVPSATTDIIEVDGVSKAVVTLGDLRSTPRADQRFEDITKVLQKHLPELAPLIEN